jgi:hypothetical protein
VSASAAEVAGLLAARRAGLESLGVVAVRGSVRELKIQTRAWNRARKRVLELR